MYAVRTIMLALGTALVAVGLMATPALAAHGTPVEAVNEVTGEPCGAGGQTCTIIFHSEIGSETTTAEHVLGLEITHDACAEEFALELAHDGSGHIVNQVMTGDDCTTQTCGGTEGEWDAHIAETGPGQETMEVRACLEDFDGTGDVHCSYDMALNTFGHSHFELTANDERCHATSGGSGNLEITGHWISEDAESDDVEIVHL